MQTQLPNANGRPSHTRARLPHLAVVSILALLGLLVIGARVGYTAASANTIQLENAKPGSTAWQLTNPATNREIEGYASATSITRGEQITFMVSTAAPSFQLRVFRLGWYGGAGGREMMTPVTLPGQLQSTPSPDTNGEVECRWTPSYTLAVPNDPADPTSWASGVYVAQLTASTGKQSYIIFVVRDDARAADFLFQSSVTTYQAYNNWGGKSLYSFNSSGSVAAVKVSFNRPYAASASANAASGVGAGEFLTNLSVASALPKAGWECNMMHFLEREGYDVSYCTDIDTHATPGLLLGHKGFLSVGHDEYWSWQMRQNVTNARDQGVSLGFFTANACYWQVRFEPSLYDSSAANRTMVGYKEKAGTQDPYALDSDPTNDYLITTQFRLTPVNTPEDALIGVSFKAQGMDADIVVSDASNWVYTGTGLQNGSVLPGLLGYEVDGVSGNAPSGTSFIAHSPAGSTFSDASVYTAASGAIVFATGSIQWAWGLDDYNAPAIRTIRSTPAAQQITRNVLDRMAPTHPPSPPAALTASPGDGEIGLNWSPSLIASSYNVWRSTTAGGPYTRIATALTNTKYFDESVTNGTTYYYVVAGVNNYGESTGSNEASATPAAGYLKIESGGGGYVSSTSGRWQADQYFAGNGATYTYTNRPIGNTNDPLLYLTVRYGSSFSYALPASGSAYTLKLHFAECFFTAVGQRSFNVSVNGTQVLSNYDIVADAGGANIAVVKSFSVAPVNGFVNVSFSATTNNMDAELAAIELAPSSTALPAPPSPTNLTASVSNSQVLLNWVASAGAATYSVKRSSTAGGPYTTIASNLTNPSYIDNTGITTGSATFYYVVTAINASGESAPSNEASATVVAGVTSLKINAGGPQYISSTTGTWLADQNFNGGTAYTYSSRAIANTADPGLYLAVRFGASFSYALPATGNAYTLNLHFVECNYTSTGQRLFNVLVNGAAVLTKFDIVAASGGPNTAIMKSFAVTPVNGQVTVTFNTANANPDAIVSALELKPSAGGGGATIPATPPNLTATPGNAQVVLSWTPSAGATSYNLKRSTTRGGPYTTIAAVATTNYTDTGLTNDTTYYYVVSAVNSAGESANSDEASATPKAPAAPPVAPTNLAAAPGNAQVALSWNASASATSYNVKRSTTAGGPYSTVGTATTTSFTNTGLTNGTRYYYVVTAVNSVGESPNSNEANATPLAPPLAPAGLTATAGDAQVTLSWSASTGAASYNLKRGTTAGGPYSLVANVTTTSYMDLGLANGIRYYYVVTAVNSVGESPNSNEANATPLQATGTLKINAGGGQYVSATTGTWQADQYFSGGSAYTYPSRPIAGTSDPALFLPVRYGTTFTYSLPVTGSFYTLSLYFAECNFTSAGQRYFNVSVNGAQVLANFDIVAAAGGPNIAIVKSFPASAVNGKVTVTFTSTNSSPNAVVAALQLTPSSGSNPPPAPSGLTATAGDGQVMLSWTGSAGATSYNVKRSSTAGGPYTTVATASNTAYTDSTVTNGASYYYVVTAIGAGGESGNSNEASATPQAGSLKINAGGGQYVSATTGTWRADQYFSGGSAYTYPSRPIAGTNDPALFLPVRFGTSFTYTLPATSAASYTLKLYFAECNFTTTGQRFFNVSVNGAQVLANFDIVAAAGGPNTAVVESFPATPANGQVVVTFTSANGNPDAIVSALELVSNGGTPPPVTPPASPAGLTAVMGDKQVALNWSGSTGATSYNVKRGTSSSGPYTTVGSSTAFTYTDTNLTNGTIYYYVVTAVNSGGESGNSNQVSATPLATPAGSLRVNVGGGAYTSATAGTWQADQYGTGGSTYTYASRTISGTSDPSLYLDVRYGTSFTYTLPATGASSYTVKLHFAECNFTSAGQRLFNVSVNGTQVLSNFDIVATAGAPNTAIVKGFAATPVNGQVTVTFSSANGNPNAVVSAIELIPSQ